MKRFIFLSLLFSLFFIITASAQKNSVSGAMMIQNTDVIKTKKETNPNLFLLGEVSVFTICQTGHEFLFTAGYRIKERFVAGGGIGYFGCYDEGYPAFAIYGYGRADILKGKKLTPFVSAYLGGNIPWGGYISTTIGLSYQVSKKLNLNLSTGYLGASGDWGLFLSNLVIRAGVQF